MPSDERLARVLEVLAEQRRAFQTAVDTTGEQIDHYLAEHGEGRNGTVDRFAGELGPFASDRIDVDRFSALFQAASLDGRAREAIEHARNTLGDLATRKDQLYQIDVASGASLAATLEQAYAEIGRAFGAARVFDQARTGRHKDRRPARSLGTFPFAQWNSRERAMAPPLVVTVDGADLRVGGLAEFLDGSAKIVLLVRGEAPPAPLVRLITPGTFVLQTHDESGLDRCSTFEGPGIAAWLPETAARFVHDPSADGLSVDFRPETTPKRAIGGSSAAQQTEELAQLRFLASVTALAAPAAPAETAPAALAALAETAPAETTPADKLAAWLLRQADLENVG